MDVSIVGCGWFGRELAGRLINRHSVSGTTRSEKKKDELQNLGIKVEVLSAEKIPSSNIMSSDIMILNIPPFEGQLEWFKEWKWQPGQKIIFISSTSVYGNRNGEMLETIVDLPPSLLIEQERWIRANFEHWCILRFAGLVGNARHPGKILSGKTDLKGQDSPVNLLHLEDAIGFTQTVLERNLWYEIFNVCSDEHSFKKEFYTEFAERENLPLPMFDESDRSSGKLINNQKMKSHYQLTKAFL